MSREECPWWLGPVLGAVLGVAVVLVPAGLFALITVGLRALWGAS